MAIPSARQAYTIPKSPEKVHILQLEMCTEFADPDFGSDTTDKFFMVAPILTAGQRHVPAIEKGCREAHFALILSGAHEPWLVI